MTDGDAWLVDRMTRLLHALPAAANAPAAIGSTLAELVVVLSADLAAVVDRRTVIASSGPAADRVPPADVVTATTAGPGAELTGIGRCDVALGELTPGRPERLVVVRAQGSFSPRERTLVALSARTLALALELYARIGDEEESRRADTEQLAADRNDLVAGLTKRDQLMDNLGRIERSISQRSPLSDVLATITDAMRQMLGDEIIGLRLLDPDDADYLILVADSGVDHDVVGDYIRTAVGQGVGGLAVAEDRLVMIEDYQRDPRSLEPFVSQGVRRAMAAPVHEGERVVGSLTVATVNPDRAFGPLEQETLLAFAEHVSLALSEARTLESMREAQRAKDNLLAMVSHELKTPLTVIMGVVQTMQRHAERLPDDMRTEMLASAQERGHELEGLIDRLLQGARGEPSGINQVAFLPAIVAGAVRPFEQLRRVVLAPVPDDEVDVDALAVQNALGKLLENAVAHSPEGTEVLVATERTAESVRVTVTNVGALPADVDVAALFAPFQRGPGARSPGIGLGLFIAARLAAGLGGTIDVTTGDGTVSFTLIFPARTSERPVGLRDSRATRRSAGRRGPPGPKR